MIFLCCDDRRKEDLKDSKLNGINLNGICFLEVIDDPRDPDDQRQRELYVYLILPLSEDDLKKVDVIIRGGERIRNVEVTDISLINFKRLESIIKVQVKRPGDFSTYTLKLIKKGSKEEETPDNFDPILSTIDFSFKVNCPSDFDCKKKTICLVETGLNSEINYLAKDYASFRQLMLDRLSVLLPEWRERNAADLGIVLVELLAYVGDRLSYQQDAVATEAYLGTARHRISVRRHARLVDYYMHDGCNARTWVQVKVRKDIPGLFGYQPKNVLPKGTKLLTLIEGLPNSVSKNPVSFYGQAVTVFETMEDVDALYRLHEKINFYTWGAKECCLPKGATKATLEGKFSELKKGKVLIFEEIKGPKTGYEGDADPNHRHAVRLIKDARTITDPIGRKTERGFEEIDVTEIEWGLEDALPFPLCISSKTDKKHGEKYIDSVSIVLGNIVLADHGLTITSRKDGIEIDISERLKKKLVSLSISLDEIEYLGTMPEASLFRLSTDLNSRCKDTQINPVSPRFTPRLMNIPLTQVAMSNRLDTVTGERLLIDPDASATALINFDMAFVKPAIQIFDDEGNEWEFKRDLIYSSATSMHFTVEVDDDGYANIRFGDGIYGARPKAGIKFYTRYRVGNGIQGNIGRDTLRHIISDNDSIIEVRNPMPSRYGRDPESIDEVRQNAPVAFRKQERAVTVEDYEEVAGRYPQVQKVAATLRWTGSWNTVFLTVDRTEGQDVDDSFKEKMAQHVELYRMAGHDLEVGSPIFVPLELDMKVCVLPEYFRSDVVSALMHVFSNGILPDGRRGVFHPDNFTFGQTVYLSQMYAAAQSVEGVAWIDIINFQRRGNRGKSIPADGKLEMGRLEIARLDNDPNFPDRGVFILRPEGGK